MKINQMTEYQTPRVELLELGQSGVLCSSPIGGATDGFKIDDGLTLEDF